MLDWIKNKFTIFNKKPQDVLDNTFLDSMIDAWEDPDSYIYGKDMPENTTGNLKFQKSYHFISTDLSKEDFGKFLEKESQKRKLRRSLENV